MTFLELVQALASECDLANEPADTTNQTGQFARLVRWCRQAYVEIQNAHDANWRWLRHGFTLNTTANQDTYSYTSCVDGTTGSAIERFNKWRLEDPLDPPRIYRDSAGVGTENFLSYLPYTWFKQLYKLGDHPPGYPAHITVDPQNNILLGPTPNDEYVISAEYFRSAQSLTGDGDEPEMPSQYHYLIIYEAMKKYGYDQSAQELIARGEIEGDRLKRQLENNQSGINEFEVAGPLA